MSFELILEKKGPDHQILASPFKVASYIWEFPKIRVPFLGVPIIRTIVFGGLYWAPPILGNYHIPSGIRIRSPGTGFGAVLVMIMR